MGACENGGLGETAWIEVLRSDESQSGGTGVWERVGS